MFIQEKIGVGISYPITKKKVRNKKPSFKKRDKIKETLREWNTIKDVELYQPLYELCSQLFLTTQNRHLECLNYYIDTENDGENCPNQVVMYAEIKDTWELPLKERYNKHLELLKRVMSNDTTLIYCNSITQSDDAGGQLSLFSC